MFKRTEKMMTDNNYDVPAKRAKLDDQQCDKKKTEISRNRNVQYDDLWGDDFDQEDIEEMDLIASQACLQEGNILENSKLFESSTHSAGLNFLEKPVPAPTTVAHNETVTSRLKTLLPVETFNSWTMRKNMQGTSRDSQNVTEIDYSQFKNKLMDRKDHNSTFQNRNNIVVPGDKELEKLRNENKKLLNDFITKDGEIVFLRQQLQQAQLRVENEKLEKMHLIEEQANRHRSQINNIYKEKEQLKTQLELQNLEIGNLLERCKLLESGSIKLKEPQVLYNSHNKSKCSTPTNRLSTNRNLIKETCTQVNTYKKNNYQLKTCNTYFPLAGISELMFTASMPEKPVVNIKIIEKTGRRNLPILQEEETFRIFENPDLVKPIVTMVDEKRLTIEFILLEIAALEQKVKAEIESETCVPIINKLVLTARELTLNVIMVLQTIFQAMRNDDIRDMNDLYFSTVYKDHNFCIKSECEADAWHEGERGIEARRLLGALSRISLESLYLRNYLAGKSPLFTRNDDCYNHYLPQMMRYNAWPMKGHEFEMLEIILECVTLIGRVRRSHQFTGLINAIIKVLCNVQQTVGYCEKGLQYVCLIFKELVFSRPLSLCYVSLVDFVMVFSKCNVFVPQLCRSSHSMAIKMWKGALHFTPDACVLQILMAQMEHFHPDFLTTVNMTHSLISSVWYILHTNNNLLRPESSESCNCYVKLLRFTINMLKKCSEIRLDVIDSTEWQNPFSGSNQHYALKRVNYKDCACQVKHSERNTEKRQTEEHPEKLDRNYWSTVQKIQHKVSRQGIRFLCHLVICDPDFVIRSSDIENSFHLFVRNITFSNNLILHRNEQEALDRIRSTFIFDKGVQNEAETHHKDTSVIRSVTSKQEVIPATRNYHTGAVKNNRMYAAVKTLYNSKMDYKNN
ncbi:uncharacterized protein LOC105282560 isoform X2 [Ooceraea biroi]|uniref:uncharacterized protein LOC105282560 isoform X2 n=1 Tax=Ooceraea biroi TaxID=2015173 RepID=UPI0005BC28AA|nr:uncharacterized protein LOC105282560 isoform X2 [Ooceraea biroi]